MVDAGLCLFMDEGPETEALDCSNVNSRIYGPDGRMTNRGSIIKGSGLAAVAKGCLDTERLHTTKGEDGKLPDGSVASDISDIALR